MKYLPCFVLILAGCAHVGRQAARPTPPAATSADQVIPVGPSASSSAYPAEYEEYYVGMIPDADDPNFAYQPGDLIVQTKPARFRFGGGDITPSFDQGPVTFARMANDHPEPTDAELAAMVARSQRAMAGLTEENERLSAELRTKQAGSAPVAAKVPAKDDASPAVAARKGSAAAPADDSHLNIIAPNADYVIELDPDLLVTPAPATNNPFVQLYQPPVVWRDLEVQVSASMPGPKPTAIINGEPYSVGDRFQELIVYRVEGDTVYLRKDSFLLACPVSERTLKLRLP